MDPETTTTDTASERELLGRLRAGDDAAFTELVRLYGPRMLATTRHILRDEDEAQDALQEAFVSAAAAIGRFEANSRLSTWLHRIAVNAALMRRRRRRPERELDIEPFLPHFTAEGQFELPPGEWAKPADIRLERQELGELVLGKIDQLPETHRNVLMLRDIEELSGAEAAQALGISPNAVKVRLHRARMALRELLAPHMTGGAHG
ncbi:MAG TPA: sigma-70 family RNA polymerase sigma factor [Candidatus Krumholzibacteria bacterium]|jgi:RNA polymerase sigma-70 factor (ECF subfamily)